MHKLPAKDVYERSYSGRRIERVGLSNGAFTIDRE